MLYRIQRGREHQPGVPEVLLDLAGGLRFGAPEGIAAEVSLSDRQAAALRADGWLVAPIEEESVAQVGERAIHEAIPDTPTISPVPPAHPASRRGGRSK